MRTASQIHHHPVLLDLIILTFFALVSAQNDLPKDFERIVPRGRIAAISEPTFVPASQAVIAGDAVVLGVVLNAEARAFSLNLLNFHEVVNDSIGVTDYAAVW